METTQVPVAVKRTRRSPEQWHAIMVDHFATDETPQQLADRLGCALSTVEVQMKKATAPERACTEKPVDGFVEVKRARTPPSSQPVALSLQTATGITITFSTLPPPAYLAAALGLSA